MSTRGVLDTSIFIARESGRPLAAELLPDQSFISVISVGELHAGVLTAKDTSTRARRLRTMDAAGEVTSLPINATVAAMWALQRARLQEMGRRIDVNDLWIAATAAVADLPVYTQDEGFQVLAELGLVDVILL